MKDYILDNRTEAKAKKQYDKGLEQEEKVIYGLKNYYKCRDIELKAKKVDEDEQWLDGKSHRNPDYWVKINEKTTTLEIKCTSSGTFLEDVVYVKPSAIWTMLSNRQKFPNGKLLVATHKEFAVMDVHKVSKYPVIETEAWGGKRLFHIPVEDFKWLSWVSYIW